MKVTTKVNIVNGAVTVPKGTDGLVWSVTNSEAIQKAYGLVPSDGWYYLVNFPVEGKVLCAQNQLNIQ